MEMSWEAVNAIGSWVAGIGTISVVILALRQTKPKIKVTAQVMSCTQPIQVGGRFAKDNILFITITNTGQIPVNITGGGIKAPKKSFIINPKPGDIPKVLMPSEQTHLYTDWLDFQSKGLKHTDVCIAWDSSGSIYYTQVGLLRRISRAFWWKFGSFK